MNGLPSVAALVLLGLVLALRARLPARPRRPLVRTERLFFVAYLEAFAQATITGVTVIVYPPPPPLRSRTHLPA